jgi:hypothetical protein
MDFGSRAILLCGPPVKRLRARPFGMEEVISGAIAFCSESTFAVSAEICAEIFLTSECSSVI